MGPTINKILQLHTRELRRSIIPQHITYLPHLELVICGRGILPSRHKTIDYPNVFDILGRIII